MTRHLPLTFLLIIGLSSILAACGPSSASTPPARRVSVAAPTPTEPSLASPLPGSYAALGASETYGYGATPHTRGFAYLVAHALHSRQFVDVGIPGTTLAAAYETELTNALTIRPWLATVFFGANDIRAGVHRDAFLRDLHDLVATLRRAGVQVVIVGLPDLTRLPLVAASGIGGLQQIVQQWNGGMARVARETGAHYLDLRQFDKELATHPSYIASDGLHPSNLGHNRLAQVIVATVKHGLWRSR